MPAHMPKAFSSAPKAPKPPGIVGGGVLAPLLLLPLPVPADVSLASSSQPSPGGGAVVSFGAAAPLDCCCRSGRLSSPVEWAKPHFGPRAQQPSWAKRQSLVLWKAPAPRSSSRLCAKVQLALLQLPVCSMEKQSFVHRRSGRSRSSRSPCAKGQLVPLAQMPSCSNLQSFVFENCRVRSGASVDSSPARARLRRPADSAAPTRAAVTLGIAVDLRAGKGATGRRRRGALWAAAA
mmetsp:Transcript_24096/g.75002  ORF Transcript_24096/g.75002 Transcript_24096/m.75002 type:complete len:235 (-) Transcript_24096:3-707(-)